MRILFLLRKICYVHNATHQHLACDEKHDDFIIIFSAVFFKETLYILVAIFIRYFFTFLLCCLEVEHITHQSS